MDIGNIKAAGVPVIAGPIGYVGEIVGKSGSTEDTEKEYGQKDGHKGEDGGFSLTATDHLRNFT